MASFFKTPAKKSYLHELKWQYNFDGIIFIVWLLLSGIYWLLLSTNENALINWYCLLLVSFDQADLVSEKSCIAKKELESAKVIFFASTVFESSQKSFKWSGRCLQWTVCLAGSLVWSDHCFKRFQPIRVKKSFRQIKARLSWKAFFSRVVKK